MPIGKLVLIYKFTLYFNVYKNQADPHCLENKNKLTNRHWGLGVPPSVKKVRIWVGAFLYDNEKYLNACFNETFVLIYLL